MSIKIGIMTYFHAVNYGAFLQAYALCERLNQEKDFQVEIINFRMQKELNHYVDFLKPRLNILRMKYYKTRNKIFEESLPKLKLSNEHCISDEIEDFINLVKDKYDVLIAGSDEIWKVNSYRGFPTPYYLPGNLGAIKFSYAASGRTPFGNLSDDKIDLLYSFLKEFEYLGTRDRTTYYEVKNILHNEQKVHYNYDPTFIYDFKPNKEHGRRILKQRYHVNLNKKCIGIMFSEQMRSKTNIVRYLKRCFGSELELIALYDWEFGVINTPDLSPFEWIDVIAALDGVITHYFHAVCFSIITGTSFYAIEMITNDVKESKIHDLLERFQLLDDHYAEGLNCALETGDIKHFIESIRLGDKRFYESNIKEAVNDFDHFIRKIRCSHNE